MFIIRILEHLWSDVTKDFQHFYDIYGNMKSQTLYDELHKDILTSTSGITDEDFMENIVMTTGCAHRNRKNGFSGCAMCNWESDDLQIQAKLAALQKKDVSMYAKIVSESFRVKRGASVQPAIIEEIAAHNLFDDASFPPEVFEMLFGEEPVFTSKPMYGIIAARAKDITRNKLQQWRNQFRRGLFVGIGIEVGDQWIRNHWLHKNASDDDIIHAIDMIHQEGCLASGDVLLGIPGLLEAQSVQLFLNTVAWLDNTSINTILVSPLSARERTLQCVVRENAHTAAKQYGEDLSGVPSLYTFLYALNEVVSAYNGIEKKLQLSPQNGRVYLQELSGLHETGPEDTVYAHLFQELGEMIEENISTQGVDKDRIISLNKYAMRSSIYRKHISKLETERSIPIPQTLEMVGREIAMAFWPDCWEENIEKFLCELSTYSK